MTAKGIYIYGIVPNFYGAEMFRSLDYSGTYAIPYQKVSAIVSDRKSTHLNYSDRESLGYMLVHHQKTIEDLMGKGFEMLIPMRLGTIVGSKEEVIKILASGYNLIIDTLSTIEHLIEIDIAVTWTDFPGVLKEIAGHPEIVALKEEIQNQPDRQLPINQVKAGMLVQAKLKEKNTKVEMSILDSLSPHSRDIKTHEVMDDQMITNSAFLLNRSKKEKFENVISQLDHDYNGLLNFKLVGPLPCYSFYTLEYKELNPDQVEWASKVLGLNGIATESEIKKAYLEKVRLFHPDTHTEIGDAENFNRVNTAYKTLLDYAAASKQLSKDEHFSFSKEKAIENSILLKIKE